MNSKDYLLFSGGIDSLAALDILCQSGKQPVLLFVDYGQAARHMETDAVRYFAFFYTLPFLHIHARDYLHLLADRREFSWAFSTGLPPDEEKGREKSVLPGRNVFLLVLAAIHTFNPKIPHTNFYLATTSDSIPGDCFPNFFTNFGFSLALGFSSPSSPRTYRISSPLEKMTKEDVVSYIERRGLPIENTWTCYGPGPRPCKECPHCLEYKRIKEVLRRRKP